MWFLVLGLLLSNLWFPWPLAFSFLSGFSFLCFLILGLLLPNLYFTLARGLLLSSPRFLIFASSPLLSRLWSLVL